MKSKSGTGKILCLCFAMADIKVAEVYTDVCNKYQALPTHPKDMQLAVLEAFLQGKDTCCFLPTGFGKSLCFMSAGLMMDVVSYIKIIKSVSRISLQFEALNYVI